MARQQALKEKLQERFSELKALRDEIRLDLHLANMELRDEWKQIERRLPDASSAATQLKGTTSKALDRLAGELKQFQTRVRRHGENPYTVGRVMTRAVASCGAADSLARAVTTMFDADVGFLPVLGERGAVVGVITDRDAAVATCTRGRRMDELAVDTVMSRDVASCGEGDDLADALAIMRARRVRRLPVTGEGGRLLGVVTVGDAARACAQPGAGDDAAGEARHAILAALAAITEPRSKPAPAAN